MQNKNIKFILTVVATLTLLASGCQGNKIAATRGQEAMKGIRTMELNAGKATFQLPETWQDFSQYSYYSADKSAHLTVLFDSDVQEQSAEDVIQDRLATIKDVMPGFRLERSSEAALFGGRNGRSVTFDTQDADALMRTRLLVVMLAPKQAIVVTAQCSVTGWKDFEAVWNTFVSTFTLGAEPKN